MATYRNILNYMRSTGVPHRATSTVRGAGTRTAAGNTSCHARDNTRCDAVDFAGERPGQFTKELLAIFWAFKPVFHLMHELILNHPDLDFNIKNGKRVAPYAKAGHKDHVHAAILSTTALPMQPTQEEDDLTPDQERKLNEVHKWMEEVKGKMMHNTGDIVNKTAAMVAGPGAPQKDLGALFNLVNERMTELADQIIAEIKSAE